MTDKKAVGATYPTAPATQGFVPAPPPQMSAASPQTYGVMQGTSPYGLFPGQPGLYGQGPPPTYDQALAHPAMVGQQVYPPGAAVYAAGYPGYLAAAAAAAGAYPTYATPMQYYPSLAAYSYPAAAAVQPAQFRPTIMIPNGFEAGARFDVAQPVIPPAPPGVAPNAAQLAVMAGHNVAVTQKKGSFLSGGADGGYTFW